MKSVLFAAAALICVVCLKGIIADEYVMSGPYSGYYGSQSHVVYPVTNHLQGSPQAYGSNGGVLGLGGNNQFLSKYDLITFIYCLELIENLVHFVL